jgi:hypothetical protein
MALPKPIGQPMMSYMQPGMQGGMQPLMMSMGGQLQSQVFPPVQGTGRNPMPTPSLNPDYWDQPMFKPNRPAHWPTHYTSPGVHSTTPGYGEPGDWGDFAGKRRLRILPDEVRPWPEQFKPLEEWTPPDDPVPPPVNPHGNPWLNPPFDPSADPKPPPPLWWDPDGFGRREDPGYPSGYPRPNF